MLAPKLTGREEGAGGGTVREGLQNISLNPDNTTTLGARHRVMDDATSRLSVSHC